MNVGPLALTGFVLGWSVAWPPGPINAEAVRRGLSRRFWSAYAVVIGGCVGDAVWALLVGLGAGAAVRVADVRDVLGWLSIVLLIVIGGVFLYGAVRRWTDHRVGRTVSTPTPSGRGGFALGFTLAVTGPWNLAFWLAVIGQSDPAAHGWLGAIVVAAGVLAGAATWGVVLCTAVTRLGARFATPAWDIGTRAVTGLLMLAFAVRTAIRLLGA